MIPTQTFRNRSTSTVRKIHVAHELSEPDFLGWRHGRSICGVDVVQALPIHDGGRSVEATLKSVNCTTCIKIAAQKLGVTLPQEG